MSAKTTFLQHLRDCHSVFSLKEAGEFELSRGENTNVDDDYYYYYPQFLRPWTERTTPPRIQDHQDCFQTLNNAFMNNTLFPSRDSVIFAKEFACAQPTQKEDCVTFEQHAIGSVSAFVVERLASFAPQQADEFDFTDFRFGTSNQWQHIQYDGEKNGISTKREIVPDVMAYCTRGGGKQMVVFVCDYIKAVHKLEIDVLRSALAKPHLFMEVVDQVHWNKTSTEPNVTIEQKGDRQVAMALAQVFHHMITMGVNYGYLSSGKSQVFLYADLDSDNPDDKKTLYYQLCYPEEEEEADQLDPSKSAVARLASFCLLTLRSVALTGSALKDLTGRAKKDLRRWGVPYAGADEYVDTWHNSQSTTCQEAASQQSSQAKPDYNGPTRSLGNTDAKKRKRQPRSSNLQRGVTMGSSSVRTRDYCTQRCLLGLKQGRHLDKNCPNFSFHYTTASCIAHPLDTDASCARHPIHFDQLAGLVKEQLIQNLFPHCITPENYGLEGEIGKLFKVELEPYGYTFVGKESMRSYMRNESRVYSRLEHLQGFKIPVHLGLINCRYGLPDGFIIFDMMLMSWAGERPARAVLNSELAHLEEEAQKEGVHQESVRRVNVRWSEERNRLMLIDFARAVLRPPV